MMNPFETNSTYIVTEFENKDEWRRVRGKGIGGSDAAACLGLSKWKTNVQLWYEKTGKVIPEDISDNPNVRYGTEAEDPLRRLFELDHPEMKMFYKPNVIFTNIRLQHMRYSPDGILFEKDTNRWGIFENKTTTVYKRLKNGMWETEIPNEYYVQILHGLNVTEFDFVDLQVQINYGNLYERKTFRFERENKLEDLRIVRDGVTEFWKYVVEDKEPPLLIG